MTLISTRIERARELYSVDDIQYTDAHAILDINSLIREAILMRKTNWDIGTSDTVIGQSEYKATELINTPDVDIINVDKLWINYGDGFKKARHESYYRFNDEIITSEKFPIYYVRDNSVFISPTPDAVVADGIKIEATYTPEDKLVSDDDSTIKLPKQIVDVIFYEGLAYCIEMAKRNYADAKNLQMSYKQSLSKINRMLGDKGREPIQHTVPQDIYKML